MVTLTVIMTLAPTHKLNCKKRLYASFILLLEFTVIEHTPVCKSFGQSLQGIIKISELS